MKKKLIVMTALCFALAPAAIAQAEKEKTEAKTYLPGDVVWTDGPAALPPGAKRAVLEGDPGKEGFCTERLKFPDGYKIAPHTHPQTEHVTVISGTFNIGMGEKFDPSVGQAMAAGSYFFMPAGMKHFAWTTGETVIQLSRSSPSAINYLNPADDPRNAKAAIAPDAMKVVTPDQLAWKDEPVLPKGAQNAILIGDPSKAETIVLRTKFPPHYKIPPHNHTFSEVVTVLSGTCWNGMGDDMEKGVMLKPGSVFVLPGNHPHQIWTTDEEAIIQVQFTGPGNITYINPADDPRNKAQ